MPSWAARAVPAPTPPASTMNAIIATLMSLTFSERDCTGNGSIAMTPTEIIGAVAATLTTIAFVPQVHKVLVYKDTHSLSLGMYLIFTTGVLLWGTYGYLRGDWVIVTANAITAVMCLAILVDEAAQRGVRQSQPMNPMPRAISAAHSMMTNNSVSSM